MLDVTVSVNDIDGLGDPRDKYPPELKIRAVASYMLYQSEYKAAEAVGVTRDRIKAWRKATWWPICMQEIKKNRAAALDNKITRILSLSLDELEDRLHFGNHILDRQNVQVRVPVPAKDLSGIIQSVFKIRSTIRGEPTTLTKHQLSMTGLKEQFESFAKELNTKKQTVITSES